MYKYVRSIYALVSCDEVFFLFGTLDCTELIKTKYIPNMMIRQDPFSPWSYDKWIIKSLFTRKSVGLAVSKTEREAD